MKELEKVLDSNEKVFWEGKPKFWPFFLGGLQLVGSIFLSIFVLFFVSAMIPYFWFIAIALIFAGPIYKALVYKYTYYAITNKRVLIQKGLVGRDFEMVDFDQITNAEVNVGVIDKLFGSGSGSIIIATAGTFTYTRSGPALKPYTISNVENPYEVFKFFKKVSHAVKTDIKYPNKYRPKTNPGYNTTYNPKKKRAK